MPQQGIAPDGTSATGVGGAAPMPAFFFSPAQYQEMMQQYFTHMMTANQYGVNMAFPMPFGTTMARPSSQVRNVPSSRTHYFCCIGHALFVILRLFIVAG